MAQAVLKVKASIGRLRFRRDMPVTDERLFQKLVQNVLEVGLVDRRHDLVNSHEDDKVVDLLANWAADGHDKYFSAYVVA